MCGEGVDPLGAILTGCTVGLLGRPQFSQGQSQVPAQIGKDSFDVLLPGQGLFRLLELKPGKSDGCQGDDYDRDPDPATLHSDQLLYTYI